MTNKKTARIIEKFVAGKPLGVICREEGKGMWDINKAIERYFFRPALYPIEILQESSMNEETVSDYTPNC